MKLNSPQVVASLDMMITEIDNAIDELLDDETPEARKAEQILLKVTMELNVLVDRLTDEEAEDPQRSGAV